jgi:hypothetical protein
VVDKEPGDRLVLASVAVEECTADRLGHDQLGGEPIRLALHRVQVAPSRLGDVHVGPDHLRVGGTAPGQRRGEVEAIMAQLVGRREPPARQAVAAADEDVAASGVGVEKTGQTRVGPRDVRPAHAPRPSRAEAAA